MGSFSGPKDWGRLLTAMVTPFAAGGEVDLPAARRLAAHLVDFQRNDGLVVNGTTGESPTLKHDEKLRLLDAVLEEVGDRAAVLFGASTFDTAESVALTREGSEVGSHGIMAVSPYYSKPGQRGLEAHFRAIADATELPVLLYNIQPRSAINLETPTLLRLAEIENVVGVKEASGNVMQIQEVCAAVPDGFRVYSGDDFLTLPILSVGGHGVVSVAGHVVGDRIADMLDAWFALDPGEAARAHLALLPAYRACFAAPNPVPVKHLLAQRGFGDGSVRLPLVPVDEAERTAVEAPFTSA